ncbi:MAG: serine protease Do [Patescibacteria group bacterium]|nr:serine protease Do [Patescibacteria group bacterium]
MSEIDERSSIFKGFYFGLGVSIIILVSFFTGAIADRLFVIKPLDYLFDRSTSTTQFQASTDNESKLCQMIRENSDLGVPEVAEVASESVVTVSIQTQQRVYEPVPGDPFGIFGFGNQRIEQIEQDIGTGFVVDQSGLIVTNKHVVSNGSAQYKVIDKNGQEYEVKQIYRDPANDLAILKIEGASLPILSMGNSDQVKVGEGVIAIGTALGEFRHTVTTGVVSGLGRGITAGDGYYETENLENVIQTDAAINPGNSGGPLLNMRGEVIGVNVAVSANAQNIGFALPINVVKASIDNFNQTGQFDRPFLGVSYIQINAEQAVRMNYPQGALLQQVVEGSVAAEAGLQVGDVVTELDGQALRDQELATIINKKKVGDQLRIKYWRDGESSEVTVTLRTAPQP